MKTIIIALIAALASTTCFAQTQTKKKNSFSDADLKPISAEERYVEQQRYEAARTRLEADREQIRAEEDRRIAEIEFDRQQELAKQRELARRWSNRAPLDVDGFVRSNRQPVQQPVQQPQQPTQAPVDTRPFRCNMQTGWCDR